MPTEEMPGPERPAITVRDAFDDPRWRKAARQTLVEESGGGPKIAVPFLASGGLVFIGVGWILTGGEDGSVVLRILGLPMIGLGSAALRLWWRSFRAEGRHEAAE